MNMAETTVATKSLFIQRVFDCDRDTLFNAWSDADVLCKWFAPEGVVTEAAEVDLRIGGKYCITLRLPDGDKVEHYGSYREIVAPEKLVFSWMLDGQGCDGSKTEVTETLVTVEFREQGKQTEVSLTHEFFLSDKAKEMHAFGWNGCLDSLHQLFS